MSETDVRIPNLPLELAQLLEQIPRGKVTTYGDLAEALGTRQAARWVGEYLVDHPHDDNCPCHRVVRINGELGRYIADVGEKEVRLQTESVDVAEGRVDLERFRFRSFSSQRPLAALVQFQETVPARTKFTPYRNMPRYIGGVDLAYDNDGRAVAAYVSVNGETGEVDWSTTIRRVVAFPYISGMLSFRESPVLQELLAEVRKEGRLADVVIVDGNGILHPRFAGIASHLGVLAGVRTIGIGKKLLCGRVDLEHMKANDPRSVTINERLVGMAVRAGVNSRPIFVSPGHQIDVAGAVRIVSRLFFGHRLPEPLHQADALSRQGARGRLKLSHHDERARK